jgi:carbamoyl-phosphate synthase small subunit
MRSCLTTELGSAEAVEVARQSPSMEGMDYVKEVSTPDSYLWSAESREWTIPNVCSGQQGHYLPLCDVRHRIVAFDFGIKYNILRRLRQAGFEVELLNARTSASEVLRRNPDGIFLSNGPGDPAALGYIHEEMRQLIGKKPIFGICLGNQILGHAFGGKTFKLKFGHRGGNQPVKDLRSGKISITSQNHGFAVDPESLPANVEVTHVNLNDGTVEGIRHKEHPVFSVQYHPEASPGPNDASYFFREFAEMIDSVK